MEGRLLKNPNPKYWLDPGTRAWAAQDNAHGGMAFKGVITGRADVDGRDGYRFEYASHDAPGITLEEKLPAENIFTDEASLDEARAADRSIQEKAISDACSTPGKLVAFLLSRSGLPENERAVVLDRARRMGLAGVSVEDET